MKPIKAFGRFWYDFIIGDDPKIAVAVSSALAVLIAAMHAKLLDDHSLAVLGGAVVILFFAASLAVDARPASWTRTRRRNPHAQQGPGIGPDGSPNANHDRGGTAQLTQPAAQSFLLQRVQPAMTGLIDGSLSTLAPIFSVAIATHNPHTAFIAGTATALGAGVSMAFSEGLSDTGDLTGRGNPYLRGSITGLGTFLGGIVHTLPFLIPHYRAALATAVVVITIELLALAWLRWRFFQTRFLYSFASIALGGAIIAGLSATLGSA
jgi:VIT1/CCC1 family predicted Fe2+/Mn2+ transporter